MRCKKRDPTEASHQQTRHIDATHRDKGLKRLAKTHERSNVLVGLCDTKMIRNSREEAAFKKHETDQQVSWRERVEQRHLDHRRTGNRGQEVLEGMGGWETLSKIGLCQRWQTLRRIGNHVGRRKHAAQPHGLPCVTTRGRLPRFCGC